MLRAAIASLLLVAGAVRTAAAEPPIGAPGAAAPARAALPTPAHRTTIGGHPAARETTGQTATNLLVITIDTLRADHLSCYGYRLATSPRLDALAAEGTRFARAYTPIPLTGPAHASLFTGRWPQEHGAKINGEALRDDAGYPTLAEVLGRCGRRTAAFISAWPLRPRMTHLDRGFDLYDDSDLGRTYQVVHTYRSAADVTPKTARWLRQHQLAEPDRPFFLWVHYFDPHKPYDRHPGFEPGAEDPGEGGARTRSAKPKMAARIRRYDSEIAYTDHHVGELLDELSRLGLRDTTLVAVMADHGESLGEHGYVGHGRHLYENIVRVPLLLRWPGRVPEGQVIERPVSLVDVMPTLLDLLAVAAPPATSGESLVPTLVDRRAPGGVRPVTFLTFAGKKGWAPGWLSWMWHSESRGRLPLRIGEVVGDRKLVWSPRRKALAVYDLATDPGEVAPLDSTGDGSPGGRPTATRLAELNAWFRQTARPEAAAPRLSREDTEALRSLGYLE